MNFKKWLNEAHYSDTYGQAFVDFVNKYKKIRPRNGIYYIQFSNYEKGLYRNAYSFTDHRDPVGIYAYPIDYVLNHPGDIYYGANARFLRVLKKTKTCKTLNLTGMTNDTAKHLIQKLPEINSFNVRDVMKQARKQFPQKAGGRNWAKTLMTVIQMPWNDREVEFEETSYPSDVQTKRILSIGYNCLEDQSKSLNTAAINDKEPEQIVFLSRNAFEVVEEIILHQRQNKDVSYLTANNPDHLKRRLAQKIAELFNDKIKIKQSQNYYTVGGRIIYVYYSFEIPKDIKLGQKSHRTRGESSQHYPIIEIYSEYGNYKKQYSKSDTFDKILNDIKNNYLSSKINPLWQPRDPKEDKRKEKIERYNKYIEKQNKKNQIFLNKYKEAFLEILNELNIKNPTDEYILEFKDNIDLSWKMLYDGNSKEDIIKTLKIMEKDKYITPISKAIDIIGKPSYRSFDIFEFYKSIMNKKLEI